MKITTSQLKKIIAEEIKKVHLRETGPGREYTSPVDTMLDAICNVWKTQYDPESCDVAREFLGDQIDSLITQVEEKLANGEF